MLKETELFFESQVREDRPVQDLLRADYTFLNEQLARHYGINDVFGGHFRRVTVTDERRRGLLGHASADDDVLREPDPWCCAASGCSRTCWARHHRLRRPTCHRSRRTTAAASRPR